VLLAHHCDSLSLEGILRVNRIFSTQTPRGASSVARPSDFASRQPRLEIGSRLRRTRRQDMSSRPPDRFRKILKTRAHRSLRRPRIYTAPSFS